MTQIYCHLQHDREETLIAYLYDDIDPVARAAFDEHLGTCERCRTELRTLSGVRKQLARWAPPELTVASAAAAGHPLPAHAPATAARSWWRDIPAWAQVAAALLFLGVSAGVANLDVRYDHNGLTVRTGWSRVSTAPPSDSVARRAENQRVDCIVRALQLTLRAFQFQDEVRAIGFRRVQWAVRPVPVRCADAAAP